MGRKIRWLLVVLLLLAVLLVAAAVVAVWLFDPNEYRERIASEVRDQTGLELVLEGDISLSLFPWVGVEIDRARVENPEGYGPEPLAAVEALEVHARLLPLLRSQVHLRRIRLDGVALNLVRDEQGRGNWEVVQAMLAERQEPAEAPEPEPDRDLADLDFLQQLQIGSIELSNSRFVFDDRQSGERWAIEPLDLQLGSIRLGEPIDTRLTLRLSDAAGDQLRLRLTLQATLDSGFEQLSLENLSLSIDGEQQGFAMDMTAAIASLRASLDGSSVDVGDLNLDGWLQNAEGERLELGLGLSTRVDEGFQRIELSAIRFQIEGRQAGYQLDLRAQSERVALNLAEGTVDGGRLQLEGRVQDQGGDAMDVQLSMVSRVDQDFNRVRLSDLAISLDGRHAGTALRAQLQSPQMLADLQAERIRLDETRLQLNDLNARLSGELEQFGAEHPNASFSLRADPFDARALLLSLTGEAPAFRDPEALTAVSLNLNGQWRDGQARLVLENLGLDGSSISGELDARADQTIWLRGDLRLDQIDLDRYQIADDDTAPAGEPLDPDAPLPIPVELLRMLDADINIRAGQISAAGMSLTDIETRLRASDGLVRIDPISARVYGGRFSGSLDLDVRGEQPQMQLQSRLEQVQAGDLLVDLTGREWLRGSGSFSINADTGLASINQARAGITGGLSLSLADGALMGINIADALTEAATRFSARGSASEDKDGSLAVDAEQRPRTDFSVLGVSMSIVDGVFTTNDLNLQSSVMNLSGGGGFNLADGSMDFRIQPRINRLPESLDPRLRRLLEGTPIPMRISGPLTQPAYRFDLAGALVEGQTERLRDEVERRAESAISDLLRPRRDRRDRREEEPTEQPEPEEEPEPQPNEGGQ